MRVNHPGLIVLGAVLALAVGCSTNATLFSDTFQNFLAGNVVPLTPGEPSQLILVRLVNETPDAIEFVVTAEKQVEITDEEGNRVIQTSDETVRLRTFPFEAVSEVGALFDCPVTRIGLGEDIDRPFTDAGLFILEGFTEVDDIELAVTTGVGVPSNLQPLNSVEGNFGCGDTIILRVIESQGEVGNIKVQSFVLPWATQPTEFSGPHTFNNVRRFLEEQLFGGEE
ncbi:MAG: hypothetical protein ACYSUI_08705 [Planctomycetota bacterium]|jgi:hypothetical protein